MLSAAFMAVCGLTMLMVVKTFTLLNDTLTYRLHLYVGVLVKVFVCVYVSSATLGKLLTNMCLCHRAV